MDYSLQIPPTILTISIVVIIFLIAGILLAYEVSRMGRTFREVTGTVKQVTADRACRNDELS